MKVDKTKVLELVGAALEFTSQRELDAYIDSACGADQELREKVLAFVAAYQELETPPPVSSQGEKTIAAALRSLEASGTVIDRYKLLERMGEGGMGTVWLAEQTEPVQRRVALKVIRQGLDSGNVLARFEAERQALALMDHPNIAKVLDAGTTATGRSYFVMELVKGIPITKFCDERRLSIRERLELFIPVCHAIQHAHQKGVIHRDIKPSNVLVALYEGKPMAKVIDFGIAKATGQRLTPRTLFTEVGALVGTPEYMSPEQAELNQLDIDTRSDIYSLGVLLYEILTGTTPLTREALRDAAFGEILRRIKEVDPPKPSTRLTESKEQLPTISTLRKVQPAELTKEVKGDLDWIVMKSLEKDRQHRYQSATELWQDIEHYLAGDPVLASRGGLFYRAQKFSKRHRKEIVACILGSLLIGAAALSVTQARHSSHLLQAKVLAEMRTEERNLLTHVIAGTIKPTDKAHVQACVSRLTERIKKNQGSESDNELLARFLVRRVFLRRNGPIQEIESAIVALVAWQEDYTVDGVGAVVTPHVVMEGKELPSEHWPQYLGYDRTSSGYGTTTLPIEQALVGPGTYTLSGHLDAQLVYPRGSEFAGKSESVRLADYRPVGHHISIQLQPVTCTFVQKLPADYPPEILDEQLWRKLGDGLIVKTAEFSISSTGTCSAQISFSLPRFPPTALPLAFVCRLIQVADQRLDLELFGLRGDTAHVSWLSGMKRGDCATRPELDRNEVEVNWTFVAPQTFLRLTTNHLTAKGVFSFRPSRRVARDAELDCFAGGDGELKKTCALSIRFVTPP